MFSLPYLNPTSILPWEEIWKVKIMCNFIYIYIYLDLFVKNKLAWNEVGSWILWATRVWFGLFRMQRWFPKRSNAAPAAQPVEMMRWRLHNRTSLEIQWRADICRRATKSMKSWKRWCKEPHLVEFNHFAVYLMASGNIGDKQNSRVGGASTVPSLWAPPTKNKTSKKKNNLKQQGGKKRKFKEERQWITLRYLWGANTNSPLQVFGVFFVSLLTKSYNLFKGIPGGSDMW